MSDPARLLRSVSAMARAAWRPERPDRIARAALAMTWGGAPLTRLLAGAVARYPRATAIVDDDGTISAHGLWSASDALARELQRRGVGDESVVGLLARNSRWFAISMLAAAKLGADVVFLNTGFAGPQLADVAAAEGVGVILHDDAFAGIVAGCALDETIGAGAAVGTSEMAAITAERSLVPFRSSSRTGRFVILTSGTTGRPKGANRSGSTSRPDALAPLLGTIPIRARDTVAIPAPLFHAWGLSHLGVALGMSSTVVLSATFDPEATLALIDEHRPDGLIVVPVMLQRIMTLGGEVMTHYDTTSLRYIASSGSALGAALATEALHRFGPILYNVYGSTEVALATIATPADLQVEPATAGRAADGTTVRILDDAGAAVPVGTVGRIFVGSGARFEGYTGGGGKEEIDGLLSSGDVGRFDADGRLFVEGRDDDMIVSGGENVFPVEVEDLLAGHPDIVEAAVIGVADERFGQRLKAFVVRRPGATLGATDVKTYVREHLARYKVPGKVVFVDVLPRTTTGKLRRQDLR